MKNKFKSYKYIVVLLALIIFLGSCSSQSLKKNKIYVSGTDSMGDSVINKDLFKSFDQLPTADSVDFPKTMTIKLPDGTEGEGEKRFQSTIGGKNGIPYAEYAVLSSGLTVKVTENGMVLGIETDTKWTETDSSAVVLSEEELIEKAKEQFKSFFGKDIPEDCTASLSWDYTEQGQKGKANISFDKQSEGYTWLSGIIVRMTASGELLSLWDSIQLISGKNIPSGFADDVEEQLKNWIKDDTATFTLSQQKLRISIDGKLMAHAYVELNPAEGDSFGIGVNIPLE